MNMHPLDWAITVIPLVMVLAVVWVTRSTMKSVADFLSGGRHAGRYLLAVAKAEMTAGAAVFVAYFELIAKSGFVVTWWSWLTVPIALLVTMTGFVTYRFRETRAMTLAQFFELRYSKDFRLFTGFLGFFAGIVNFGVIPVIGAKFFIHFLHLPQTLQVVGFSVPTYVALMALFMGTTLLLTLMGGMVSMMIANCIEGILSQLLFLVIIFGLLYVFDWSQISSTLAARPPGHSLLNPYDSLSLKDFNVWFVLMGVVINVYGTMAWQNQGGYNSAGLSAHETRMGGILGRIREMGKAAVILLLGVCGVTLLENPHFAVQAADVAANLATIADPQTREQMRIPIALSYALPMGAKGAFCAVLLMGLFGGDSNHLHSWGSIFVQDILVPLRNKPLRPDQHLFILRCAIVGVAVFAFLFGCFFQQTDYILMWWQITMALYIGGAGAAIIGGLYWKKGTTAAAWTALILGSGLSAGGIVTQQIMGGSFPFNGTQVTFIATVVAILAYIVVSLLTHREDYNMDRMLHRGSYAESLPETEKTAAAEAQPTLPFWMRLIGYDENFTRKDKWVAVGVLGWSMFWFLVLVVGSIWNALSPLSIAFWSGYWHVVGLAIPVFITVLIAVWFTWGGVRDMVDFMRRLKEEKPNPLDDGTVIGHKNLAEAALDERAVTYTLKTP